MKTPTLPLPCLVVALAALSPFAAMAVEPLQSAVDPRSPAAGDIAFIWWLLLAGGTLIFVGVMTLLLFAMLSRRPRRPVGARLFIVGGGLVFPGVVLSALLVYTVIVGARITAPPADDALQIDVTAQMWWWDVRYRDPDGDGSAFLVTANELRIPVGKPVLLRLHSADVIHSFWVPNLSGKVDMIPGRVNRLTLQADAAGTYRGQCAEFCGLQHSRMALHVVAEPVADWERWVAQRREVPAEPAGDVLQRGRRVFLETGCVACHAVRGVSNPPPGLAPDLTHVGSRPSIGAGLLTNTPGNLAAWIASAQSLKPGSKMPSFHNLDGESLTALAAYLASLE